MATYAIGDIQGCYDQLRRLLDLIRFDVTQDTLWLVGDLVNRGPQSLATLRFVRGLGERAITVLGNHEFHLLVVASGLHKPHRGDTLDEILDAPDRDELLDWVRHRKMIHADSGHVLVHAGLLPQWTVERALMLAGEVETALQGSEYRLFLQHLYGNEPVRWDEALEGYDRLRLITNAMTRLRLCDAEGRMEFSHKTGLGSQPASYMPWFDVPGRASSESVVICGHWAALGIVLRSDVRVLDSGCVWGRELSALRLEDQKLFQCHCGELEESTPE